SDRGPSHPCGVTPRIAIASDAPRGAASRHLQPASSAERLRNEGDDQPETAQPTDDRDSDLRAWLHCGLPGGETLALPSNTFGIFAVNARGPCECPISREKPRRRQRGSLRLTGSAARWTAQ